MRKTLAAILAATLGASVSAQDSWMVSNPAYQPTSGAPLLTDAQAIRNYQWIPLQQFNFEFTDTHWAPLPTPINRQNILHKEKWRGTRQAFGYSFMSGHGLELVLDGYVDCSGCKTIKLNTRQAHIEGPMQFNDVNISGRLQIDGSVFNLEVLGYNPRTSKADKMVINGKEVDKHMEITDYINHKILGKPLLDRFHYP